MRAIRGSLRMAPRQRGASVPWLGAEPSTGTVGGRPRAVSSVGDDPHALFKEQMEQLKLEREELFGFTQEEHSAWSNANRRLPQSLLQSVEQARADAESSHDGSDSPGQNRIPSHGLTHLSEDGGSVQMVDVGDKATTKRTARAETKVVLPPEVMAAFPPQEEGTSKDEWMGPKGPIFATAKIAGILAAKKTSDLIPLCHPLPLDQVQIDIRLDGNIVLISCECHVTHKTGVEMEALTGASIAALTVYDMLKALSHHIRIEQTVLVSKSGGKRTVG